MNFSISLDFSQILMGLGQVNEGAASLIHKGIGITAQKVKEEWADKVSKAPGIWSVERKTYINSLRWEYTGPYSAVVTTDYKIASEIESGRPAKDLKRMLDSSMKVRNSKKGRYLIIPFRHNVPAGDGHSSYAKQMPAHIYAQAKALAPSRVTSIGSRASGTGALDIKTKSPFLVPQRAYDWGAKLPKGMAPKKSAHHTSDFYAGMVRMQTGKNSSAYITFRIMGVWQTGKWIVDAKPGQWIARSVAQSVQTQLSNTMEELFSF